MYPRLKLKAKQLLHNLQLRQMKDSDMWDAMPEVKIQYYKDLGYVPWKPGYNEYKWQYIQQTIKDPSLLTLFSHKQPLPPEFGQRIDERIVEYPWFLAHLNGVKNKILDAGSSLNFPTIIDYLQQQSYDLTIMTLFPEKEAFWQKKVSYHYGDLRQLPFQDEWFDTVVSISTLEHIGFDNTPYNYKGSSTENNNSQTFEPAVLELWRVLKSDGTLLITVPYGLPQEIKWSDGSSFLRQIDENSLQRMTDLLHPAKVEIDFFKYTATGWQVASQADCNQAEYHNVHSEKHFKPDYAAAARSVACIRAQKS